MDGRERRLTAERLAAAQDGVVSRAQLATVGITRHDVRREVAAERWRSHGSQTVAVHTGPISMLAQRWRAVWETGENIAALDGVTALQQAGLRGFDDDVVHVSAVHNHNTPTASPGFTCTR
jgi:hypothetical protein